MKSTEKESDIQLAICQYLALKKYFFWRTNTVGMYDPTKKIFRAMPKYGMSGVPDIILIKDGFFVGLEVKKEKTKQSDNQKEFERRCKENGAEYHIVRKLEDLKEIGL
jgi:hypothetical protein